MKWKYKKESYKIFDGGGISNLLDKGVFIMGFRKFLVRKIEWKRVLRVWKKVNMCKWFRVCKWFKVYKWMCKGWSV